MKRWLGTDRRRAAARLGTGALAGAVVISLSGCAAFSNQSAREPGDGVRVATAFYPLQYAAERVAGDHADVVNLTTPGAEPHDLELSPAETADIARADLVVHEKDFQPSVDDAIEQNASGKVIDAAAVAGLEPFGHDGHDHGDEGVGPGDDEDTHDHGELDPHFWQDPLKLAAVGDAIAADLAELDPEHAEDYRRNADDLRRDLTDLDSAYATGLADCARHTLVVSHDAFGYLSKYGLDMEPIAGLSPDAEPTPADLARLQDLIAADGITTVFSERLGSPRLTEALAHDMGITSAVLDPIEGLSDETSNEDYLSLMRQNLAAIKEANQCR